jgi:predicted CXXCH cytochrome family protein
MKVLLVALFCQLAFCSHLLAAQQTEITGAVAYTETIQFDYTKDGTRNRVQFWLDFKGSPALGKPGEAGYQPESGAVYYYLVDLDNKKQVDNWLMGFSMMEGPPPSGPYPMTEIEIRGNMAMFTAFGMKWTVIDGGAGYARDTVKIDDGFTTREMKLHGGDFKIVDAAIEAHAAYQDCVKCHAGPTLAMRSKGGKHNTVGCGDCHVGHPPEVKKPYTACMECHEPHSDQMTEDACNQCHRAHTATEVMYAFNVPSAYCAACHQDAADELAASRSKHSDIACALCHQERHGASSTCQYCHGGTHPQHVMKKTDICAACHHTAHDLESARTK